MTNEPPRVLTLCGSVRARSSNRSILQAFAQLAAPDLRVEHYERLGALPHFNPDLDGDSRTVPLEVEAFRRAVSAADAIVISTPEYAHGLPGAFKNALDWLVSDPRFAGKPVGIIYVERGSSHALNSLREVLKTMAAVVIADAVVGLPLTTNEVDAGSLLAQPAVHALLRRSVGALRRGISG